MSMRCFFCNAPDVQHTDPRVPACIGVEDEGEAMDVALERAAAELAEEQRIAAEAAEED
jgi:hypothetical protein